jgi:trehalose-phosphatase
MTTLGTTTTARDLSSRLEELARTPVLLVASDFDGTLSPIAAEPSQATPNREAIVALHALAATPQTHAAVISGRSLRDLSALSGITGDVFLVGSHGSEFDPDFARRMDPALVELREQVKQQLAGIADGKAGFLIEEKPASLAFHFRKADPEHAERAVDAIMHGPAKLPGVHLKHGKMVLELSVVPTDKGKALAEIRHRVGATAAIFIGDDKSDEDGFATLCGPDVGVKIGEGPTTAEYRVNDTTQAAKILARLAEQREQWIKGAQAVPIEQHSMLSDQRTVALMTPDARIVWYCAPRIDSPALFAELVGGPAAGFFAIRSADGARPTKQSYMGNTFHLRTEWPTFTVTDFMDCSGGRPFQRAGRTDLIRFIEGKGRVKIEFAPRLDFGRHATHLREVTDGLRIEGSPDPVVLRSPGITWNVIEDGSHQRAVADMELLDKPIVLELRYGMSNAQDLVVSNAKRNDQTVRFWELWAQSLQLPALYSDPVRRSALVLKALSYGPTGAIAAAATTSLPEHIGGIRNWDYRYCWLRDAALSATALARLGSSGTGTRLVDWILTIMDREESPDQFRPVYTVTGGHLGPEADIRALSGYRGSRPVRVGNAAAQQLQLDVFGPIMELLEVLTESGVAFSNEHWRLTQAIVKAVGARWHEPDHGIWEIRAHPQHHVHSKVMCWMAVDRGLKIARAFTGEQPSDWLALRDTIADDVLRHGWSDALNAFTATYDLHAPDAATLHIGLSGLLSGNDPRFVSTVEAVERTLRRGPTVYRYLYDDALPGREGGFHFCTAWLIEALVLIGEDKRARELLEQLISLLGPTGLAPEEYCPKTQTSLGNHPQAYTHIGLINAVISLSRMS